jgi:NTE family protein
MQMTTNDGVNQRPRRTDKLSLPGRVVLVMQGGGAPGCYQAGAYQALHEAGIEPDWVIGTSIGAINGAIIGGNQVSERVEKLQEFWGRLDTRVPEPWNQLTPLLMGVPNYCYPNPALAWGFDTRVGIERAAVYLINPLKKLLPTLVDFNLINSGATRFTLGLTTVETGQMRYFDNMRDKIGPEHILGSSAVPPNFPAILVDGQYYWDGGVYSNSPRWFLMRTRFAKDCVLSHPVPSLSGVSVIAKSLRRYRGLGRDYSVSAANTGAFFSHHLLILGPSL